MECDERAASQSQAEARTFTAQVRRRTDDTGGQPDEHPRAGLVAGASGILQ
jgi:hypothetical protein